MRSFLRLSYNGMSYHGWQIQPHDESVQQRLEESLSTLLRQPTVVTGAGRTDAGVHARTMYAHFDHNEEIADKRRFLHSLNRLCGRNIVTYDLISVDDDAHARFDATSRTYKYFVTYEHSPFLEGVSWHSPTRLDLEKMNRAAERLLGKMDYTSFAKLHSDTKTNICEVTRAEWSEWQNMYGVAGVVFTITADRFLRNMVRAIVGTLVDVGRGKLTLEDFERVIAQKDRCAAGNSMPPQALFLWDITYPYIGDAEPREKDQ